MEGQDRVQSLPVTPRRRESAGLWAGRGSSGLSLRTQELPGECSVQTKHPAALLASFSSRRAGLSDLERTR